MSKKEEPQQPELKYGQLPPDAVQVQFVKEASDRIRGHGFMMNRSFDEGKVPEALQHAKLMLEDMRTNTLCPIHYDEIYQHALNQLSSLALTFQDPEHHLFSVRRIAELYEELQYTENIVPRLYLLFTLAPAFIKCGHAKACDVMRDLIEMARGVQHPTRALFLRHYLLHVMKDVLPDAKNTEGGTLEDTLNFILENFKQMNVLWVRLEFSLDTKTTEERKQQRSQLKQLVGSNIQRISSLRGLDVNHYKEIVLPKIIEQITACKEQLAQSYIIESITQVFPAEFHIETLEQLFGVLMHLEDDVSTLSLVIAIIKRLQTYYTSPDTDLSTAIPTVRLVAQQIDLLLQSGQNFSLEDTLDMLGTLLDFTLKADSSNSSNVNSILHFVENHIEGIYGETRLESVPISRKLRFFLITPLREMKDSSMLFDLSYFPILVNRMRYNDRKLIALEVCKGFSNTEAIIDTMEKLRSFFGIVQVILQRPNDYEEDPDNEPIANHLQCIARVFHLVRNPKSIDETFSLLCSVSTTIQNLTNEVKEHLYMSLGMAMLRLAVEIDEDSSNCNTTVRNVLQHIYSLLSTQNDPPQGPSFWLFIEATKISDKCGSEAITTEFFVSAFNLWKEGMFEGNTKYKMLLCLIRTATQLKNMSATRYNSMTSTICSSVNTLLQKDQRAEAHLLCSHMFNVEHENDQQEDEEEEEDVEEAFKSPDKIKNCLVRSLKATAQMMDPIEQLPFYYKVLAHAIYFLENGVQLSVEWFNVLTAKIDQDHEEMKKEIETKLSRANKQFYINLIKHKEKALNFE
ncbi:Vacuolar protein sorting-associated protein 35 [Histomonas meleagridis]|uniref:Vacuolar protein sorting-associated protein 35 n=1 Tax=Histomonas meleagridis TaxID=135588 RepID=UPI00355A3F29|nr:Vacuolar protein sorting-associated protein 35 [Histomonas meleagridis]KAH0805247.1 Vacuolar protein sorting-associated protein 35 [Histomonas meleagridis]